MSLTFSYILSPLKNSENEEHGLRELTDLGSLRNCVAFIGWWVGLIGLDWIGLIGVVLKGIR